MGGGGRTRRRGCEGVGAGGMGGGCSVGKGETNVWEGAEGREDEKGAGGNDAAHAATPELVFAILDATPSGRVWASMKAGERSQQMTVCGLGSVPANVVPALSRHGQLFRFRVGRKGSLYPEGCVPSGNGPSSTSPAAINHTDREGLWRAGWIGGAGSLEAGRGEMEG